MLNLLNLYWRRSLTLISVTMAVFAASSYTAPLVAYSAENSANVPEAFLLRCRARGLDAKTCREGFTRAKQTRGLDNARALLSKCRLTGRDAQTCQKLINASFKSPNLRMVNRVKAHCLRNNIKKNQCRALIADKLGGGTDQTQRLMARCTATGLNQLECKKRMDVASHKLGGR
ncbi:MAG: hypothetical protein HOK54_21985 [Alphaproteobacteria bacterium]|nr:hypothetical protein [Alphaproteobacteria bacterium]